MSTPPKVQKETVIRVELTEQQYELLSRRAKEAGFSSVESYVAAIVVGAAPQPAASSEAVEERVAKRVERAIQDVLNPFTQKIDELAKRLAEIQEDLEELKEALKARPQAAVTPPERAVRPATSEQSAALERLRRQGVVFSEDVAYMRAPDRFFAKLERLGAVVIQLPDGQVAADPEFWRKFMAEVENTKLPDARQVADKLAASLGERAATLFTRLVKGGVVVYDEDSRRWVLRTIRGREGGEEEEGEEEENY